MLTGLRRLFSQPRRPEPNEAALLIAQADAARDAGRFDAAAELYARSLVLAPGNSGIRVQCGHMAKESGRYDEAERHYLEALRSRADDDDLAMQLGHLYKITGRYDEAEHWYRRALALRGEWPEAAREIAALAMRKPAVLPEGLGEADYVRLVPDYVQGARLPPAPPPLPHIELRRLGRSEPSLWGMRRTLRGVEAIRGFCLTRAEIVDLEVVMGGTTLSREAITRGSAPPFDGSVGKYVFNAWIDFTAAPRGLQVIELRFRDAAGALHVHREEVVVAGPVDEAAYPASDARVSLAAGDGRSPEDQIRARASMIRPAARALFPEGVRNILVLRTDQLGDLIASIPAMRRLRALAPDARIVALLTAANADLAATLDLFNEMIVIDFPDDPTERRRLMPWAEQERLRTRLAPYRFDIAIDLAQSSVSRELLRLSGARFVHGMGGGGDWPWLQGDFVFNTPDRWTGMDTTPHGAKILALIEALGAILVPHAPVIRRDDLSRDVLAPYGIPADARFALLHLGARIVFSRWPHFAALALRLLAETDLDVVMMGRDPATEPPLPPELLASPRFHLIEGPLPFAAFDAFLSFAEVVVGNDSGPKHLAALRGTPVVTLFSARINWTEWGQENVGWIVSRRVPCAGCAIFHDTDECGKDFACVRDIGVGDVMEAVRNCLA